MSDARGRHVRAGTSFGGVFTPPGDKSITHRAIVFGALAEGTTVVRGANPGADGRASLLAVESCGADVVRADGALTVRGVGLALREPPQPIDCGNSGTTLRLMAGALAGRPVFAVLTGDASLRSRPVARIIEPLRRMGATLLARDEDRLPPLIVRGAALRGIDAALPVASAQVATCILLAGLHAVGPTSVTLPGPARDHTERMLPAFGVPLEVEDLPAGGRRVRLEGGRVPRGVEIAVPGDSSAASFAWALAASIPGAQVTARGVSVNPTRTGLLDVLAAMGAEVSRAHPRVEAGEDVADVTVRGPARLRAFDVPPEWVPRMIDEVPAWGIAASAAEGVSRVRGATELRVKESDRIAAMGRGFAAIGIGCREFADGLAVEGGVIVPGRIPSANDHRIAMAFGAIGARTAGGLTLDDVTSVETSYPAYFADLESLGAIVEPRP